MGRQGRLSYTGFKHGLFGAVEIEWVAHDTHVGEYEHMNFQRTKLNENGSLLLIAPVTQHSKVITIQLQPRSQVPRSSMLLRRDNNAIHSFRHTPTR